MPQQVWKNNIDGGYWASPKLSDELRHQAQPLMRFLQEGFVRLKKDFNAGSSDTIYFDKMSNVVTAGRVHDEEETTQKTKVKTYRGQVTVYERCNAVSWSGKLETLSQWDPNDIALIALRDDMAKVRDAAAAAAFQATDLIYVPTGTSDTPSYNFTTNGTAGAASTRAINCYDVKVITRKMKTYNIPLWDGVNYMCISSINGLADMADDPDWKDAAKLNSIASRMQ